MELTFKEISRDNWEECIDLKVAENQRQFVAANWYSILQGVFEDTFNPVAIYDGETMVGFLMYGEDPATKRIEMCRLMVDEKYQGQGYGKQAIVKLLDQIRKEYGKIKFYTSIEPENLVAQKLYESIGFKKTGEIMWDEVVMVFEL